MRQLYIKRKFNIKKKQYDYFIELTVHKLAYNIYINNAENRLAISQMRTHIANVCPQYVLKWSQQDGQDYPQDDQRIPIECPDVLFLFILWTSHTDELRGSYQNEVRTSYKDELRTPYQNEVRISYKDELRTLHQNEVRRSYPDELGIHLTYKIKN